MYSNYFRFRVNAVNKLTTAMIMRWWLMWMGSRSDEWRICGIRWRRLNEKRSNRTTLILTLEIRPDVLQEAITETVTWPWHLRDVLFTTVYSVVVHMLTYSMIDMKLRFFFNYDCGQVASGSLAFGRLFSTIFSSCPRVDKCMLKYYDQCVLL